MSESSDDSVDTVISALDSRHLSQSLSTSSSLSVGDEPPSPDSLDTDKHDDTDKHNDTAAMGNRLVGDKKKKKDDIPQERKAEEKPKKKKSKSKSKRHSRNVDSDFVSEQGACSSPSSSSVRKESRSRSRRPDVLADLGAHAPGSPLGSPESTSGSQGTWSYDGESDASTLGYSTPLLSTPQIQRYVLPKQTSPQQSSSERLEELGRSIEKTIVDKLSDRPSEEGSAASSQVPGQSAERKVKRNVKKKRALGQSVIDSESFTLPLQDWKAGSSAGTASTSHRLNVGTEKISLRASQESTVSPWLRDDDTPIDEEQMDEMFISCIDVSYNLADICSEKEFTEYGSLDSKTRAKADKSRAKDTSLSPRIARKPIVPVTTPWSKELSKLKSADSRDSPPKSDSSTSTLAEAGCGAIKEIGELEQGLVVTPTQQTKDTTCAETSPQKLGSQETCVSKSESKAGTVKDTEKKSGKSKSKSKAKKNKQPKNTTVPAKTTKLDIPAQADNSENNGVISNLEVQSDLNVENNIEQRSDEKASEVSDYDNEPTEASDRTSLSETVSHSNNTAVKVNGDSVESCIVNNESIQEKFEASNTQTTNNDQTGVSNTDSSVLESLKQVGDTTPTNEEQLELAGNTDISVQLNNMHRSDTTDTKSKTSENLSPKEATSPKHVPPPSPSAMDILAEVDEDDEEAMESCGENSQMKEVQLFGETVFKRLSSLVESQSQDEDIEERFKDFRDPDEAQGETDSPPVDLASMALLTSDSPTTIEATEPHESLSKSVEHPKEVVEEEVTPGVMMTVDRSIGNSVSEAIGNGVQLSLVDGTDAHWKDDKDIDEVDDGTLKRKKKKSSQKKGKKKKKDPQGNVVKRPEIPAELKHTENTDGSTASTNETDKKSEGEFEKENTPPKRESQQIQEVIDAYGLEGILDVDVKRLPSDNIKHTTEVAEPQTDSDDYDDNDSDCSSTSRSRSSGLPSSSSLELSSRHIPEIEETFSELLSVKHILEDLEDRTPTEERLPSFVGYGELRSPTECGNGRRSRMSPAVTDRTESDLDISEQRDDISTDSMYADDEDDGASEILFSRSYSEPTGNEVVVSCTFYNTTHNNNNNNIDDSDDFWEDYSTADESFKQIEISADAATSTFQNARKQMQDIHQHLQDLRRQMEHLQEEVESATLTPEYSMDSEDKRPITE